MNDEMENMIEKFRREEQRAKKRMFLFISIPFIITLILIAVSVLTVENAHKEVQKLELQKNELDTLLKSKNDSLAEMKEVMELALTYKDKRFEFDFSRDKELFSRFPQQTKLIEEMRQMIDTREVKWHLGGFSPETGFDSPSFATFMINKYSKTKIPAGERYKLRDFLAETSQPEVGDIAFYEGGYAMFYFNYHNQPFVVGMTPVGLTSLTFDFGPKLIGFGKVEY